MLGVEMMFSRNHPQNKYTVSPTMFLPIPSLTSTSLTRWAYSNEWGMMVKDINMFKYLAASLLESGHKLKRTHKHKTIFILEHCDACVVIICSHICSVQALVIAILYVSVEGKWFK